MIKQNKTEFKSERKNYTFGISQKAIIYDPQEEKYLLIKTQGGYYAEKYGPWELVGGTVDAGEDFKKALEREIKEEAGEIEYEVCDLISSYKIFNSDGKEKIFLGSLVKFLGGKIKLSDEHTEYKWEKYKDIIEDKEYKPWLKEFIQKAQKYIEKENNLAGWKRCQADFENYKKRQETLQWELAKYSGLNLILQILPVLDNFHAATDHIPANQKDDQWVVGIMYIQKQLEKILEDNGVKEIGAKVGDDFDPKIHEAIKDSPQSTVQSSEKNKNDREPKTDNRELIKRVVLKGYKMEDKVIRAARVIVE